MTKNPAINTRDTNPLSDFLQNSKAHIARLKVTRSPEVLTVDGQAEIVVQDAASYQEILDKLEEMTKELERVHLIEAIREGERAVAEGRTVPAADIFADIRAKHGF